MEEYSVIVVSLSLTSVVLKLYANSDGAQQEENKNNPETTIERHLETVKILMSWNVQQQTNKRARKTYTGRGGLVDGRMPCCGSAGRPPRPGPRTVSMGRPAPRGACGRGTRPSPSLGLWGGSLQLGQGQGDPRFGESRGQGSCPGRGEVRRTPLCAPGRERHQCHGSGQGELAPVLGGVVAPGECERSLREGGSGLGEQGWSSRGLRAPPWGPHPRGSCLVVLLAELSGCPVCPAMPGLPKISILATTPGAPALPHGMGLAHPMAGHPVGLLPGRVPWLCQEKTPPRWGPREPARHRATRHRTARCPGAAGSCPQPCPRCLHALRYTVRYEHS